MPSTGTRLVFQVGSKVEVHEVMSGGGTEHVDTGEVFSDNGTVVELRFSSSNRRSFFPSPEATNCNGHGPMRYTTKKPPAGENVRKAGWSIYELRVISYPSAPTPPTPPTAA